MRGSPENVSPRSKLEWRKISRCQVVALQSSVYQNYWAIGEVFHHNKDILHPMAELKIIYLEINFSSHMINLLKISYVLVNSGEAQLKKPPCNFIHYIKYY